MKLGAFQKREMSAALTRYVNYASGTPGISLSWAKVVDKILAYTKLSLESAANARGSGDNDLANYAERLRRFAATPSRGLEEEFAHYVFQFLSHPDIGLLGPDSQTPLDVELRLAWALAEYQENSQHSVNFMPSPGPEVIAFSGLCRWQGQPAHIYIEFNPHTRDDVFGADILVTFADISHRNPERIEFVKEHYRGAATLNTSQRLTLFTSSALAGTQLQARASISRKSSKLSGSSSVMVLMVDAPLPLLGDRSIAVLERQPDTESYIRSFRNTGEFIEYDKKSSEVYLLTNCHLYDSIYENIENSIRGYISFDTKKPDSLGLLPSDVKSINEEMISDDLKDKFFAAIQNFDAEAFSKYLKEIEDLNIRHPRSNLTALQLVAGHGWRNGYRILAQYDDKIDYAAADGRGKRASDMATIHGFDDVLARLLRRKELKAAQQLAP